MHVTMVKKRLLNGEPCGKCVQAEDLLKRRELWHQIDEVVWAEEGNPESAGMRLAAEHGIELAPFFIVRGDDGKVDTHTSVMKLVKSVLQPRQGSHAKAGAGNDIGVTAEKLAEAAPEEILHWGLERFGAELAIAFSGAEDVALIEMASRSKLPFSVFCLDTGRLHPETYRFIDRVRKHYGKEIEMLSPAPADLEPFVRQKGLFSFYEDGHQECCGLRKVAPLKRGLKQYRAWATGQRRDQSPTRQEVRVLEVDSSHEGKEGELVKLNPLAGWTSEQVWRFIRDNGVPYNELHDRGFASIGCEPCTRARRPGEHERAARWWWEDQTKRECGLHVSTETS